MKLEKQAKFILGKLLSTNSLPLGHCWQQLSIFFWRRFCARWYVYTVYIYARMRLYDMWILCKMHAHVCMYVSIYLSMYTCMYVCMYACMYASMPACMHACMHGSKYVSSEYVCMCLFMYICMDVCKLNVYIMPRRLVVRAICTCAGSGSRSRATSPWWWR